jgi:hypothetical protein
MTLKRWHARMRMKGVFFRGFWRWKYRDAAIWRTIDAMGGKH